MTLEQHLKENKAHDNIMYFAVVSDFDYEKFILVCDCSCLIWFSKTLDIYNEADYVKILLDLLEGSKGIFWGQSQYYELVNKAKSWKDGGFTYQWYAMAHNTAYHIDFLNVMLDEIYHERPQIENVLSYLRKNLLQRKSQFLA